MAENSYLIPGVDLLSVDCITKSDVQQAIAQAQPQPGYGFIVTSPTAPDVVTYPALARFLWLETSGGNAIQKLYFYNGTSWELLILITADDILDGSLTLDKFSLVGASPYDIIQVNASATALGFISIVNAIANGSLPLAKLVPAAAGNYVLTSIGSTWAITAIVDLPNLFADNTVPLMKLVRGGPSASGLLLFTSADGTTITWDVFDAENMIPDGDIFITKLANAITSLGPNGLQYQSIRRNTANNAWEFYTPISAADVTAIATAAANASILAAGAGLFAFRVGAAAGLSAGSTSDPVIFDTTIFDTSGLYDTVTGQYIVPATGYYRFTLNLGMAVFPLKSIDLKLVNLSGPVILAKWSTGGVGLNANFYTASMTTDIHLTIGDVLQIQAANVAGFESYNAVGPETTNFSGHLIHKT